MPLWLEQPAVAFIREEAGSSGQVEWIKLWTWFAGGRSLVLETQSCLFRPSPLLWLLQLLWLLTFRLFSGGWCVRLCKGIARRWVFWTVNGDMGLPLSLIPRVDFPSVEGQKPLVSRQDRQQKFCAKGKGLSSDGCHLICIFFSFYKYACLHKTVHERQPKQTGSVSGIQLP